MLRTRVLSALVFTPVVLGVIAVGGTALQVMLGIITQLAMWEFLRLTQIHSRSLLGMTSHLGCGLYAASLLDLLPRPEQGVLLPGLVIALLVATLARPEPVSSSLDRAARAMLGVVWCGGLLPLLWALRQRPHDGQVVALATLLCTWAGDTGAYFAGRAFGRTKLYPLISPKKTLEGAVGGVGLAIGVACALMALGQASSIWRLGATLGALAAVAGTVGDLCESLLKRSTGAKDSSQLIPGHGGVLDRFDGVLFATPVVYIGTVLFGL